MSAKPETAERAELIGFLKQKSAGGHQFDCFMFEKAAALLAADGKDGAMTPQQINEVNESLWAELDEIKEKIGYNEYREANRDAGHWTLLGYLLNLKRRAADKAGCDPVAFCRVEDAFDNDSILAQLGVNRGDKLYTHPQPQADMGNPISKAEAVRVPLTDEQIEQMAATTFVDWRRSGIKAFARAIEAAAPKPQEPGA